MFSHKLAVAAVTAALAAFTFNGYAETGKSGQKKAPSAPAAKGKPPNNFGGEDWAGRTGSAKNTSPDKAQSNLTGEDQGRKGGAK